MAGICCTVVGEGDATAPLDSTSRRRTLDLLPLKYIADMAVPPEGSCKRPKLHITDCEDDPETEESDQDDVTDDDHHDEVAPQTKTSKTAKLEEELQDCPKFGVTSVCGRRRDMEDSVCVQPSFTSHGFHYFGVFDGHGCSHVAMMCKERLHEIVNEEIRSGSESFTWKSMMENGFARMDDEVHRRSRSEYTYACRCELRTPHCDAVGSTAVIAVITRDRIVVSNCGDSRAVLCRSGFAIPLSCDHKPDRPDELLRVQARGGRVIYWDGPRVLGVLAMSRAIGDNYLKPFVISEPEVTVTERSDEDECLILASDGLWDVVSNETACGVVRMCLRAQKQKQKLPSPPPSPGSDVTADGSDRACSDASILLTKLALARHSADNVSVVVIDLRKEGGQSSSARASSSASASASASANASAVN